MEINPELENFLPEISDEKKEILLDSLINNGCIDPIITWNGVLVDGHTRYKICRELDIPFECKEVNFENIEAAKFFIIEHHLCQRELTVFQRCELVYPFERYIAEQVANKKREKISRLRKKIEVCPELDEPRDTGTLIAKYIGTTRSMWYMAKKLIDMADDSVKELLRIGKLKIDTAYNTWKKSKDVDSSTWWDSIRCDNTQREEVPEPESELIGGQNIVHLDKPLTTFKKELEREPKPFPYAKDNMRLAMQDMLYEVTKILYWITDEDLDKCSEILNMLDTAYLQAKNLIMEESQRCKVNGQN